MSSADQHLRSLDVGSGPSATRDRKRRRSPRRRSLVRARGPVAISTWPDRFRDEAERLEERLLGAVSQ